MDESPPPALPKRIREAIERAREIASRAHCPYSQFHVGCVLIDASGRWFEGCNVENASYSVTLCAERVAASQAVAQGSRDWKEIIIVSPTRVSPCGTCRQFLFEFAPDMQVYLGDLTTDDVIGPLALRDFLPMAMTLQQSELPRRNS